MNVRDLIDELEQYDGDTVVMLAIQPRYPFEHRIGEVVGTGRAGIDEKVFIGEGGQVGYLDEKAGAAMGWSGDADEVGADNSLSRELAADVEKYARWKKEHVPTLRGEGEPCRFCLCSDCFLPCTPQGGEMEPDIGSTWDELYVCSECGHIHKQVTLEGRS